MTVGVAATAVMVGNDDNEASIGTSELSSRLNEA